MEMIAKTDIVETGKHEDMQELIFKALSNNSDAQKNILPHFDSIKRQLQKKLKEEDLH